MKYLFFLLLLCNMQVFSQIPETYNGFIVQKQNAYFFYEVRNDSLLAPRYVVFTNNDTIGRAEIISHNRKGWKQEKHISISGNKSDTAKINYNGFSYEKMTVDGLEPYTMGDFASKNYSRVKQAQCDTIMKGYYLHQFEGYTFYPIRQGRVSMSKGWTRFSNIDLDSLNFAVDEKISKGIYMELQGKVRYGNNDGYGHFGMSTFEFQVDKIIEMDTARTLNRHLAKDLEQGFIIKKDTTLLQPKDFEYNKKYTYSGAFEKHNVTLTIEKVAPGKLKYEAEYSRKSKVLEKRSGYLEMETLEYTYGFSFHFSDLIDDSYSYTSYITHGNYRSVPDIAIILPFKEEDKRDGKIYFYNRLSAKGPKSIPMHLKKSE